MSVKVHRQAMTTPEVRADIQVNGEPVWVLMERYRTISQTICKWHHRGREDKSYILGLKDPKDMAEY